MDSHEHQLLTSRTPGAVTFCVNGSRPHADANDQDAANIRPSRS